MYILEKCDSWCISWLPEVLLLVRCSLLLWDQATTQFCPLRGSQFWPTPAQFISTLYLVSRQLPRREGEGKRKGEREGRREQWEQVAGRGPGAGSPQNSKRRLKGWWWGDCKVRSWFLMWLKTGSEGNPWGKVWKTPLEWIWKWCFGRGRNLMTLERCLIFNPDRYLAKRKCRDLAKFPRGSSGQELWQHSMDSWFCSFKLKLCTGCLWLFPI